MARHRFHNRSLLAVFVIAGVALLPARAAAQQTVAADRFVDSAGVNIHLHFDNTVYWNQFPLVKSRLIELGVRHVRDGLVDTTWRPYYDRHNELGDAGIKTAFITGPYDSVELLAQYPGRMSRTFEAYEAPNEYDKSGDPNWVATLTAATARLWSVKADPRAAGFPIIGPSLSAAGSHAAFGDVSQHFDVANMHNYFAGRHPGTPGWGSGGYGSIAWNVALVEPYAGGKPIITTETGYQDDPAIADAVPQAVIGKYMPRVLLEQFRAGITRTYLYELADFPRSGAYGLLNVDGSPKPAFTAVKGLLNTLADPGPAFAVTPLAYSVQGGTSDVRHLAFQKRDGTYFVAIWLSQPGYDVISRQIMTVPPQTVTVALPGAMRHVRTHRWQADGSVAIASSAATTASIPLTVSDALTLIEVAAPPTAPGPAVPGVPGTPAAAVTYRSVLLRWQPPSDGGTAMTYSLEAATRADFADGVSTPVGPIAQILIPDVAPGVYFVRVRAGNAQGFGAPSSTAEISVGSPEPPQLLALQTLLNPVALAWSPAAGADRYVLSAGSTPGASDLAVVDMGRATSIVAPVPAGLRIYARIAAVNAHGAARSNEVSFVLGGTEPPGPPGLVAAVVSGVNVTLSWAAGQGGAPQNYVLQVGTAPGASNVGAFPVGTATSIAADSPIPGRLFARVVAQNPSGSAVSNEIAFSTAAPTPLGTPTMRAPVINGSTVRLSWTAGSGASSYLLGARTPDGTLVAVIPVNGLALDVPGVPSGTYLVSVVSRRGDEISAESTPVAVTVP